MARNAVGGLVNLASQKINEQVNLIAGETPGEMGEEDHGHEGEGLDESFERNLQQR
jgi:inosine/xanthosine triphosphate pyrophosphatase family protein